MGSSLHVAEWSLVLSKEIPGWFIHLPADEPLACSCVLLLEISSAACVDMEGAQLRELAAPWLCHPLPACRSPLPAEPQCSLLKHNEGSWVLGCLRLPQLLCFCACTVPASQGLLHAAVLTVMGTLGTSPSLSCSRALRRKLPFLISS